MVLTIYLILQVLFMFNICWLLIINHKLIKSDFERLEVETDVRKTNSI